MDNLPACQSPSAKMVAENIKRLELVCPKSMDFSQFATQLIVCLNEIQKPCDAKSVLISAFNLCQIGLIPGGLLGHAYLIPRRIRDSYRCCVEIGYQGYMSMARESGWLDTVYADVVLHGEVFRHFVDRSGPQIEHELPIDRVLSNSNVRTSCVGAYCVYTTKSHHQSLRVVPKSSIDTVDSGRDVWQSHYYEMVRKTAIRRAAKDWHMRSNRLNMAMALDEDTELQRPQRFLGELTGAIREALHAQKSFSLSDLEVQDDS